MPSQPGSNPVVAPVGVPSKVAAADPSASVSERPYRCPVCGRGLPDGATTIRNSADYTAPCAISGYDSCGLPGPPYTGPVPSEEVRNRTSAAVWLGVEDRIPAAVDTTSPLRYLWQPYPRKDLYLRTVLSVPRPRPDLLRFQRIAEQGRDADIKRAWQIYVSQGPLCQIPVEIPCDRTFSFSFD